MCILQPQRCDYTSLPAENKQQSNASAEAKQHQNISSELVAPSHWFWLKPFCYLIGEKMQFRVRLTIHVGFVCLCMGATACVCQSADESVWLPPELLGFRCRWFIRWSFGQSSQQSQLENGAVDKNGNNFFIHYPKNRHAVLFWVWIVVDSYNINFKLQVETIIICKLSEHSFNYHQL